MFVAVRCVRALARPFLVASGVAATVLPVAVACAPRVSTVVVPTLTGASIDDAGATLDDAQIAEVLRAALTALAAQDEVAASRAYWPRVEQFANAMHEDVEQALSRVQATVKRLKLPRRSSDVVRDLDEQSARAMNEVRERTGPEFDRAFAHEKTFALRGAVNLIDLTLLPRVQDLELRATLLDLRPRLFLRMQEAATIEVWLQTPGTAPPPFPFHD